MMSGEQQVLRRRGNPNWTKPAAYVPMGPTESSFEAMVKALGLTPAEFESSDLLKEWVLKNKDEKYVPLDLLRAWKLTAI